MLYSDMMSENGQIELATELGVFFLGWNERGIDRIILPDLTEKSPLGTGDAGDTAALPDFVEDACARIKAYAAGARDDFASVPVDLSGLDAFRRAIYETVRKVGCGETVTYGELCQRAGFPGKPRETGAALGRNPVPLIVPCHRVLAAGNQPGGFSAPGGVASKMRLLAHEGVDLSPPPPAQAAFVF